VSYHEENESGRIRIGRGVIESVSARVIDEFDGRVIVSDPKGRLKHGGTPRAEDEKGFARARVRDGKLDIKLYLIVQFGASLRETAKTLVDRIRKEFPEQAGIDVGLLTLVFVGTLSEKLSKRNIVFVDDGELREAIDEE
jgi:uncharacterized alkaline shock family protein YloU